MVALSAIIYLVLRKIRLKKLKANDDYVEKPTFFEKRTILRNEKYKIRQDLLLINELTDFKWERDQPFRLHCKKCNSDFKSPKYEIFCPKCKLDSLYIAKFCQVCQKWTYFQDERVSKCRKCKIPLLKDYILAKDHLIEQGYKFGRSFATRKDIEAFYEAAEVIPIDKLRELVKNLFSESKEDEIE
jgi:hypothetical protein